MNINLLKYNSQTFNKTQTFRENISLYQRNYKSLKKKKIALSNEYSDTILLNV